MQKTSLARLQTFSLEITLLTLGLGALAVNTLGRGGGLNALAALFGLALLWSTGLLAKSFFERVSQELGKAWLSGISAFLLVQVFWAFFKAPLDVDGLFYHLVILLEALQKGVWGAWSFGDWHIQNTPKLGELPNLYWIALGGYRFAQFGHLSSGLIGATALVRIAQHLKWHRPALLGVAYLSLPLVAKQMSANYVDLAGWSYWLAAAALLLERSHSHKAPSPLSLFALFAACFLHSGVKISGPVTLLALAPLLFRSSLSRSALKKLGLGIGLALLLSASTWMLPNLLHHSQPLYPLQPLALLEGQSPIPPEMGISSDFHGTAAHLPLPSALQWVAQIFLLEPIAVYDQGGGAWGMLGVWGILVALLTLKLSRSPMEKKLLAAVLFAFLLMPARIVPRHGLMGGVFLILFAYSAISRSALRSTQSKKSRSTRETLTRFLLHTGLPLAILFNFAYGLGDRVLLRGVSSPLTAPRVIWENFKDIITDGEPQAPGRWMHAPYVPLLRKKEPRVVLLGKDTVPLKALYWGRTFSNEVRVGPHYCKWPMSCATQTRDP